MEDNKTISLPEPLVQGIIDFLKTQRYEDVFQLIASIMQSVQAKADKEPKPQK